MRKILSFVFCMVLFLSACGEVQLSGGVSEETNTLAGVLLESDGSVAKKTAVSAISFADSSVYTDTTNNAGRFELLLPVGTYALSASLQNAYYYEILHVSKRMSINALALPLDTFRLSAFYEGDTTALETELTLYGTSIKKTLQRSSSKILLPHGDFVIHLASASVNFENVYYRVKNSLLEGPFPTELSVDSILSLEFVNNTDSILTLPAVRTAVYSWNFMNMNENTVESNGSTLYVYGSPLVSGEWLVLDSVSKFAVSESDSGMFDEVNHFGLSMMLQITEFPKDSVYRKNILGKVGYGFENDESAFSLALVRGECGIEEPKLGFFIADGKTSLESDCFHAAFADVLLNENMFVEVSFENGSLKIFENGTLAATKNLDVSTLVRSKESIYLGKENVSLKAARISLYLSGASAEEAFFEYAKGGL